MSSGLSSKLESYIWVAASADSKLCVFNYNTHKKVVSFEAHPYYTICLTVHASASIVLTGSDDMTIKARDWVEQWKNNPYSGQLPSRKRKEGLVHQVRSVHDFDDGSFYPLIGHLTETWMGWSPILSLSYYMYVIMTWLVGWPLFIGTREHLDGSS